MPPVICCGQDLSAESDEGVGRMKIVDLIAHVLSTPLEEPFAFSQGLVRRRSAVVVEVVTDEGVTGWGESLCHGLQPPEVAASFVEFCYKPMLVGRDPFDAEVLWEELYNRTRPFGGGTQRPERRRHSPLGRRRS